MNAREIQQALEGVAAECLDKDLKYNNVYAPKWVNEDRLMVNDSHAAKIQCDSMVEWLMANGAKFVSFDPPRKNSEGESMYNLVGIGQPRGGYIVMEEYVAPTRLEALAKACKAMKENAQ